MFNNVLIGLSGQATEWYSTLFSSVSAPQLSIPSFPAKKILAHRHSSQFCKQVVSTAPYCGPMARTLCSSYSGGLGSVPFDGSYGATFINHNATAFEAATVLQSEVVNPIYPAVFLWICAFGAMLLWFSVWPSTQLGPTLDGWGPFVFGVDLSEQCKGMPGPGLGASLDYENAHVRTRPSSSLLPQTGTFIAEIV